MSKQLKQSIHNWLGVCGEADSVLARVDMGQEANYYKRLQTETKSMLQLLEGELVKQEVMELKECNNKNDLIKLVYVVMRSINIMSDKGILPNDPRIAVARMVSLNTCKVVPKPKNWLGNDMLYQEVFLKGIRSIHPYLIQKMILVLLETLSNLDGEVYQYLEDFYSVAMYNKSIKMY